MNVLSPVSIGGTNSKGGWYGCVPDYDTNKKHTHSTVGCEPNGKATDNLWCYRYEEETGV